MPGKSRELVEAIENADMLDIDATHAVWEVLGDHVTDENFRQKPSEVLKVEEIIHLIDRLFPGWAIHITGTAQEPDGHWHCNLRRSEILDNDKFLGWGKGKHLQNALVAALLRTFNYKTEHNTQS